MSNNGILQGSFFMDGDTACAEGAICAGCRFFGGYPITPATEIAERMARRLPQVGGTYIQMEDEIASISAVLGASWAGTRAMTATSGPGFSLMMENLGLGIITETPCVLVNVQRGGPSTGMPTLVGQGDMMQARWGSHGPYETIALSPGSPQELFDLTIRAFNLAEKYRTPVLVMTDEAVGHMTERVVIPPLEEIEYYARRKPQVPPNGYLPYRPDPDGVPPMACAGEGYRIHVTGLTHNEKGYPDTVSVETQQKLVERLIRKIRANQDDIIELREDQVEEADVVVVAYGISARTAARPVRMAREMGLKVGLLKLVTVWPFAEERIRELAPKVEGFVVPEINMGQIAQEVERCAGGQAQTILVPHAGGGLHHPNDVLEAIKRVTSPQSTSAETSP
ncbi:MAG: 2-oxoacid:acceptor oxidoreductase subunit alpha [Anaerolineales bacterium]|nr:MAG: 2-oxoacid:acceptor oxidoreductase subunit alpha [Anaerolineales bacterium]